MTLDLTPAAQEMGRVALAITDDQLTGPTPCPGYDVGGLLAHVLGLAVAFRDAGRKKLGATTDTAPEPGAAELPPGWRDEVGPRLDALADAWRPPEAWEGMTQAGGVTLPGEVAGQVALNEIVIHGWDLARATGQAFSADEASAQASYEFCAATTDDERDGSLFGPVVPVPPDAPLLDRAIGMAGRNPHWTP
ncbi:conserved hypothetical protein [Beutenbergia cavernae DSM 12333]|uniref:Mycothiol-dependent maleylpyruvate isomerase metal-binding domain-containing protein n=1 Tax=Beutenbergia cavernae (strain ATCC BAA-8 / DSM 12333 / CCUG 43141 / JCM 11478 / NBRC 16432 / NCIMB 13614 / HKI 0122) TaxID=471853 RepID=C5C0E4_BEUC1|nr:TIGR03086 family metal-binding protein [Beutenbergia cavernae]ACQ79330.1 conserved hypothetical protein [Beutenbergia cavernae DSM 12333]